MHILLIHGHMFHVHTWSQASDLLAREGITLHFFSQVYSVQQALGFLANHHVDLFIGHLFHDLPGYEDILAATDRVSRRIGIGQDFPDGFSTFTAEQTLRFTEYLQHISVSNYYNAILHLVACTGRDCLPAPPEPVMTHGVYHPRASALFASTTEYLQWHRVHNEGTNRWPLVGLLCYYGQVTENNHAEIDALIHALERHGMTPLCVTTEGMADSSLPLRKRYGWLSFFQEETPDICLNLLAGRLLSRPEDITILEELNVPVIQLLRLHHQTPEEWQADAGGLGPGAQSTVYSLAQPEMAGVIEPTVVAASTPALDQRTGLRFRRYLPLEERIEHLCHRLHRWLRLRDLPNRDKRLTVLLHNNPCKGVEATLGLAEGLATFESLAALIGALRQAGYEVGDAPEDGPALLNLLLERKAISEFRWTTTDEMVRKGGVLHYFTGAEYARLLERLPDLVRERVNNDWGPFPGEGMVFNNNGADTLLITGLVFGNLRIMLQPKRGCYGAKCNGEVCRILHDPHLSPPPHWLATYAYIREHSDVVLHFGTHGSLEFLPGKQVALSESCFPEISLNDLPNIYLYIMDAPAEGLIAKRRGRAVLVTHLSPVRRPAPPDRDSAELEDLLDQYLKAGRHHESKRQAVLRERMLPLMQQLGAIDEDNDPDGFEQAVHLLSRRLARSRRALMPERPHRLGRAPDIEGIATMLTTILSKPSADLPRLEDIATWNPTPAGNEFEDARGVIRALIESPSALAIPSGIADRSCQHLQRWCLDIGDRIAQSSRELPQLLKALDGGFIEPGLAGSLALGKTRALPTGRNFFTSDVEAMPTTAAWEVGRHLADNLLRKYLQEEGRFPESVGISLWSIDAFKSDGEVLCQILALMGMQPTWTVTGRVRGVIPIALDDLTLAIEDGVMLARPRIDAVIQTSSILRDMVPHFADLLDEAAVLAGNLEEPLERNYIRKHTRERVAELRRDLAKHLSENELLRLASFRVFSTAPGACGTGVGLILDASAWETSDDLAETYINRGGYAYGSDRVNGFSRAAGQEAHRLWAANLKTVDVTYMRQYSPDYDLMDCSCYTGCLGGMSVAAQSMRGNSTRLYWSDANTEGDLSVRDLKEEIDASLTAKLFNRHWIQMQKSQGYQGAGTVASQVNTLFKWSATTQAVANHHFDKVVHTYIEDRDNLQWLRQENPYGLEEMTRRLLEAHSRGLWQASPQLLAMVREAALLVEGDMEEQIGEVDAEFQGSRVDVLTSKDVRKWQPTWRLERRDP
ncbi:cobaltochelatase subunit CobN [Desulfobulbus alkaliphilus]|uniref:cobaltochelatase subunit CobN n=1 Tax=Desulfobulbus alkaliphilus TaxID=869814 RepID=UPI001963A537|nr:cobaltochelatase subunit CobN [Desulfobulbus alkaliphilus]MBM9538441.1 cobaltochelatase subunit CobN [Desulfobulbus alkaliphilus]